MKLWEENGPVRGNVWVIDHYAPVARLRIRFLSKGQNQVRQQLRYFGTKMSTREFVYQFAHGIRPVGSICDAFGGVGNIGSFFKSRGYEVWSGDILKFAHCFQVARIEDLATQVSEDFSMRQNWIRWMSSVRLLNRGPPVNGWIVREFAKKRGFFSIRNAGRIDRCRKEISDWSRFAYGERTRYSSCISNKLGGQGCQHGRNLLRVSQEVGSKSNSPVLIWINPMYSWKQELPQLSRGCRVTRFTTLIWDSLSRPAA